MRRALRAVWDYLHDLGVGGWFLVITGLVAVAVVVAVVQGRSGPDTSACEQAAPSLDTIDQLSQSGPLSTVEAARLHDAAAQLQAIAKTSFGDDKDALNAAADAAAGAEAGRSFNAVRVLDQVQVACPSGGLGR